MPGWSSILQKASSYVGKYSKSMMNVGNYNRAAAAAGVRSVLAGQANRAVYGALAGGAYGAMSDDTSVLGGAMMGAAGARYLGAGFKAASRTGAGMGLKNSARAYGSAFRGGVMRTLRRDYRGARMMANQGYQRIKGLYTR